MTGLALGWSSINLEAFCLSPGKTSECRLEHPVVALNIGQAVQIGQVIEGKTQTTTFLPGASTICPLHARYFLYWDSPLEIIFLSLASEVLSLNAAEILGSTGVKLVPRFGVQDQLIYQIGLALLAELRAPGFGSHWYAETMATALAVHLLRYYSASESDAPGGYSFSQPKMKQVVDYINDNLEQDLRLKELAAIAQLSQFHFCRAFKQVVGVSPHRYLICQRIERAKTLLHSGDMSIGAVAIACGFNHQSHLHRHFKRLTGVTPKVFLKS
ncbi:helix-turn-helix transcriptional regulator [Nodosilinea sp. LEGE 07088]|uniref:helix-turn-helix domain-containing protein n=1 Tax=Nodosilinea sp. LEGE 07088 TaxID=2777968 RepID=UPI001880B7E0|nr:AraC family transcriptional regulator [Nodosilinea sp. LEGE 07088]MBE9141477.1 helix-turn-helix transcriptional regulator [Nodosilinea sp. LEGE 07088]